jgi:hypothetical protein
VVRLVFAALAASVLFSMPALSQDSPSTRLYVSLDVGTTNNGVSNYTFGTAVEPRDVRSDLSRLRVGYQFVRFFALEAGYVDLGSYSTMVEMDCSASPEVDCVPDFRSDGDLTAWTFNGVGQLPIGERFAVRANVGWMLRTKDTHIIPVSADDYNRSSRKVLPVYGVGANFAVTKKIDVFAEWSKFVGDDPGFPSGEPVAPGSMLDESDAEAYSLGVRWRF